MALKFSDYATAAGDGGHRYETVDEPILFDTVQPVRLDGYQLLFSLKSNDFYVLNIHLDADGNTVKGLAIDKVRHLTTACVFEHLSVPSSARCCICPVYRYLAMLAMLDA